MLFQTHKTFVHLQNTNWDMFTEIQEYSDPAQTATQDWLRREEIVEYSCYFCFLCAQKVFS